MDEPGHQFSWCKSNSSHSRILGSHPRSSSCLVKDPNWKWPIGQLPRGYTLCEVNIQKTMENHHFNREINYKWTMASTMLVSQRLYLSSLLESYKLLAKIHGSCPKPPCSWAGVSVRNLFERQIPICILLTNFHMFHQSNPLGWIGNIYASQKRRFQNQST